MHFAFTEQQSEFRTAVRQVLAKECTTADLRAAYDAPMATTPRWDVLAELGVVGLTVPESRGGLGLSLVDLVLLLEEAGRVALPEPLLETTAVATPLLAELAEGAGGTGGEGLPGGGTGAPPGAGSGVEADRLARWLEGIAAGSLTAAVAEPQSAEGPVAGADGADLLVLTAPGSGDGPQVHLVESGLVTVEPVASLDPTRRLGVPRWTPTPDTLALAGPAARSALQRTADRAAVATAAHLVGLSERMIAMTADYARARHQFGQPIGSFQAVKHLLVGPQVKLEFARPVVYAAAWSLDVGDPGASRAASTAKAYASDAATEAARVSLQVHGAIGYTWECDLHLFLKRAWALSEAWGSAADHRHRVLASLVGEVTGSGRH
jgi:alkylation response protein AidB-like acyl-CoA dehydrogenase